MKATRKDKRQDFILKCIIPFVKIWAHFDMKTTYIYDKSFDRKRSEPYILLSNHTYMLDVIHVPLYLKKHPFIVANNNLYTKQPLKFVLENIAHTIPKFKGTSDIRAARGLIGSVKKGYPICIFPEGNTSFNGETTHIELATMKLIKKLKIDVVGVKVQGGYLSKPRWATGKRKHKRSVVNFSVIIPKEDLTDLTVEQINTIVNRELYNNDYDYQRKVMIPHPGKNKAEGLENFLYMCPECESFGTLHTKGNTITCSNCHAVGTVNDYGFIDGLRLDNTVEWDNWQKQFTNQLGKEVIESPGKLFLVNDEDLSREYLGEIIIKSENRKFVISGDVDLILPFDEIKNPLITLRRNFNITHNEKHYLIKIESFVSSFLRVIQSKY